MDYLIFMSQGCQICVFFGAKLVLNRIRDQFSVHVCFLNQNALETDLRNSQFCTMGTLLQNFDQNLKPLQFIQLEKSSST